jgi:protein-arginine kinase activator protein McsA
MGHHIAACGHSILPALEAHDKFYELETNLIFKHTRENDKMVDELELIKNLLASINNDRKKSQSINYSLDSEKKALVDKIREINSNLIEADCYAWKNEHIDALVENLNNHSKHIVTLLNPNMMNITQLFQDRNKITEIVADMLKTYEAETAAIVRNQKRSSS